jgi:hypothetical protein
MERKKEKQQKVRAVTANAHGFQIKKTKKINYILNLMEQEDVHILMVQENNTNMRHIIAKQTIQEESNKRTSIKMLYLQTPYETLKTYKPGGTLIWIRK